MAQAAPIRTLNDWVAREALPFALDAPNTLNAAVDTIIASLGEAVELLAFGEALHGGEELLVLRTTPTCNAASERFGRHGSRPSAPRSSLGGRPGRTSISCLGRATP